MRGRIIFCTIILCVYFLMHTAKGQQDVWQNVKCDEEYFPDNCDFNRIPLLTIDDFERCAPAKLPLQIRNFAIGWAGRGITYRENRKAFKRYDIKPKMMIDISNSSLETTVLGQRVAFPIGITALGGQKLFHPEGEKATASGAAAMNTIMIVSMLSSISLEEVAESARGTSSHLWMQLFMTANRSDLVDIIRRSENCGYKAIVLTVDSNVIPPILCNAHHYPSIINAELPNFHAKLKDIRPGLVTLDSITWLKSITRLPIVAKGIITGDDAQRAIGAGASAILVSNHGGRKLDDVPATIDALSDVMCKVIKLHPRREVYLDGGIRDGFDVYKAIALGAKMVFIGRPALWGLTMSGEEGVKKVLDIIKTEFYDVMRAAGSTSPSRIQRDTITPARRSCG